MQTLTLDIAFLSYLWCIKVIQPEKSANLAWRWSISKENPQMPNVKNCLSLAVFLSNPSRWCLVPVWRIASFTKFSLPDHYCILLSWLFAMDAINSDEKLDWAIFLSPKDRPLGWPETRSEIVARTSGINALAEFILKFGRWGWGFSAWNCPARERANFAFRSRWSYQSEDFVFASLLTCSIFFQTLFADFNYTADWCWENSRASNYFIQVV